jgi:hypothetical protein
MSHDKIRAAARQRMTETGEPYTAARRAAVRGHQAAAGQDPPADQDRPGGTGYPLTMSGEIRDWLADLRTRDPAAAARVGNALATLMEEGARLGEPMVASTADSWPWALLAALDLAYQELLDRWQVVRLGEADAISLVRDLRRLATELESARAKLADARHGALIRGGQQAAGQQQAAEAEAQLAAVDRQAAEVGRLLLAMTEAGERLGEQSRRLQARAETFRVRRDVLRASYVAASGSLRVREAMASSGPAGEAGGGPPVDSAEAVAARLADLTVEIERKVGQQGWPAGLMALRPGIPEDSDFCLLFAAEPVGTALLLAVLEGAEAVAERYFEAVLAAADQLRLVRAGQAPEAAAHAYRDPGSFLAEFYPRGAGADPAGG